MARRSDPMTEAWNAWPEQPRLIEAVGGDAQLAFQIYLGMGEHALAWLDESIPALDGRTPRRCLDSKAGLRRLRQVVGRFPR